MPQIEFRDKNGYVDSINILDPIPDRYELSAVHSSASISFKDGLDLSVRRVGFSLVYLKGKLTKGGPIYRWVEYHRTDECTCLTDVRCPCLGDTVKMKNPIPCVQCGANATVFDYALDMCGRCADKFTAFKEQLSRMREGPKETPYEEQMRLWENKE